MTKKDKDKLLTVTERNKLKFAQGVDRVNNNILDAKDTSFLNKYYPQWSTEYLQSIIKPFSSNGYSPSSWGLNTFWSPQLNYSYSPAPLTAKEIFSGIRNSNYIGPTIGTPNGIRMNANAPKNYFILNPDIALNPTVAPVSQIGIDKMGDRGIGLGVTDAVKKADDIVSNNPLTKDMIKGSTTPGKKPGFNWKAAAPAIGSGVGMIGNHVISDGFNTETGTAIANAGNMIGQAVGMANPILGGIISAGSGLLGGFWNRGFGVGVDKKKEAAVESNIAAARNTGNELAQATDNQAVINAAGNMVSGVNTNVARNGLFNHKGDEINADYEKKQNSALAGQVQGLAMGADNADSIQGNNAQRYNTIASGGPLDSLMYNNDNMGAIKYGLLSDYLISKNKQADMNNKMPGIVGMPNNMFPLGGDVQTHGADFTTGLVSIDAGGSHEENPYDGVQVGVDSQGTPNLVEEGETIFNDYVFSKRIELDDQAKERFHVSKKRDITYAEMSKKLEKESSERPNDPISQAALKMQMEDLQEEQERQKAEMQAEEAREAFENMSPEEQVAVMQQVEAQDQQAGEEEAAMEEQAMAEQQMSPEEAAMAEQQMAMQQQGMPPEGMAQGMPQGIPMEAQMGAYGGPLNEFALGGNLFDGGGALKWLQDNYPSIGNKEELAKAMENHVMRYGAHFGNKTDPSFYKNAYNYITGNGRRSYSGGSYQKEKEHFQSLLDLGLSRRVAFGFAFPEVRGSSKNGIYSNYKAETIERNKLWKELVHDPLNKGNAGTAPTQSKPTAKPSSQLTRQTTTSTAQGLRSYYDRAKRAAGNIVLTAMGRNPSTSATSTAGGDTLIANAPSGGGYSAGYSGYGYTGGGGGGYSAPVSTGGTTVAAPTAGVSYVPVTDQNGNVQGYTAVPQQSAQAAVQTTAALATPTIAPYSVDSLRSQILGALGVSTASELQDWASKNNVTGFDNYDAIDWENLTGNQSFMDALNKGNSALAHAISQGYDFGKYRPDDLDKVTFATITQGNWDNQGIAGWRGSKDPAWQELLSKGLVDESKDYTPKQIEELLKGTDAFKRGTEWLQKSDKNRQIYLKAILDDPKSPPKAQEYARKFINDDGTWKTGAKTDYETIFNNPSGRAANPGTYWHTPTEIIRGNDTVNWVQKEDGTWDRVIGDVGSNWEKLNTYSWAGQGPDGKDLTYNYYKNPALAKAAAQKKADEAAAKEYEPVLKAEWPRYAGLFGPAVGLGMMAAGVGRPDTSQLDAVLDAYNRKGARFADYKPIGNYLTYNPMDIWANQNRMDANARATDRAIANNAGPLGTRNAGLVANSYASQLGTGQLHRDALAYDDQLRQQVAGFNRDTDITNAKAYDGVSIANAQIANHDRGLTAQLGMQAAQQKMAADAGWYGSMYGNINNLFKGISDLGTENARHNMIANMAADHLFGTITDNQHIGRGFIREKEGSAAEGGSLNRKKNKRRKGGLTI